MPPHEVLRTLPPATRLAAIEATMPVAGRAERMHLEDELLELMREHRPAALWPRRADPVAPYMTAIRCWTRLSRQIKPTLLSTKRSTWRQAIDRAASSPEPGARAGAARVIADLRAFDLSPVLLRLIADADADVARVADLSLLRMASDLTAASGKAGRVDPDERWLFERVVADGVRDSATHRRRGVILAGVLLLDDAAIARAKAHGHSTSPLHAALAEGTESSQMMLRAVVRKSKEPIVRARALSWLAAGPATAAALDRLNVAHSLADHEAVLTRAHLLARPSRARRLSMIRLQARRSPDVTHVEQNETDLTWPARAPVPPPQIVGRLSHDARIGMARWCAVLGMTAAERTAAFSDLLADEDPAVRLGVIGAAPRRLIGDLCFDAHPSVAASAIRHWSLVGDRAVRPDDARLVRRLARSPHRHVRQIAQSEIERIDPWNPRKTSSRLAARRMLERDREEFIAGLRGRAGEGDAATRIDAMMLAARLDLAGAIEVELLSAASGSPGAIDDEHRVAATAVSTLARVDTSAAREAIAVCLDHRVDRVRANAVEAIARTPALPLAERLAELKTDPNHRVRANALHHILRGDGTRQSLTDPAAAQNVADMLADQRPMHRVAGLWLTERLLPLRHNDSFSKKVG